MVFSTGSFLFLFLPAAVLGYLLVSLVWSPARNAYLFAVSLVFYAWNGAEHLGLLLFSAAANYLLALGVEHAAGAGKRRILAAAAALNAGILVFYKYSGLFLRAYGALTGAEALRQIALPVGVSFYTFQGLSYVVDVYRGAPAERDPLALGMYITFFPQLIAGPIVRFSDIREDLRTRRMTLNAAAEGTERFLLGLGKKVILANTLGELADRAFGASDPRGHTVLLLWLGALAWAMQIYYDFSGYSDMAIGMGRIFGFTFPENFRHPYAAATVTDFWRRWHMTLSRWFRDYVYIPLGGSRRGVRRELMNLFIVWTLTGMWHGAGGTYLLWGWGYFVLLAAEKFCLRPERLSSRTGKTLYRLGTLLCVLLLWVVFRADTPRLAWRYIGAMFGFGRGALADKYSLFLLREYRFTLLAGAALALPLPEKLRRRCPRRYELCRALLALLAGAVSLALVMMSRYDPFLYFQF